MQLYAGRPADQWRGFAALDAGNSSYPAAWYDSTCDHGARRHQHRCDNGGYANAEHLGMRRKHDDESRNAWHDAGQRHGRGGNARRIAAGLLMGELAPPISSRKTPMRQINTFDLSRQGSLFRWSPIIRCRSGVTCTLITELPSVGLHTRAIQTDLALPARISRARVATRRLGGVNCMALLSHIS